MLFRGITLAAAVIGVLSAPTPHFKPGKLSGRGQSSDSYVVNDLPGIDALAPEDIPLMWAGLIPVEDKPDIEYFFWKFVKKDTDFNRTIFWLNGGPGCSSLDGAILEVGPLRLKNDAGDLYYNEGAWTETANMVFIDQPGGTGFSLTDDYDTELTEISSHFIDFLKQYFKRFPDDMKKEFYLAGESYAGQYIPYFSKYILDAIDAGEFELDFKGVMIGNGWTDPNNQDLSYIPDLVDAGLLKTDATYYPDLLYLQSECEESIKNGTGETVFEIPVCSDIFSYALYYTIDESAPDSQQCINVYDKRLRDYYPQCGLTWPPELPYATTWLNRDDVTLAINLDPARANWTECASPPHVALTNKNSRPSIHFFPQLLERIPIMLFNGNEDIICNNLGVETMISKLTWGGVTGFGDDVVTYNWNLGTNSSSGTVKSARNLTFVDVYGASHMVAVDKSPESRGLVDLFTGNFRVDGDTVETPLYTDNGLVW
ncbi:Pheromone-processing carboxypeptidase KEX1 [Cyberlindnera fabianii]|uniref:Carboxypeptidase n=1 Tax=Cyberlindnera fabianii TaxID=36022 RepID=A0A1V2L1M6_CYBFA|nr:Pheromone-processing carboxypeptidase KEX1 [Cyberlindnera fabianii]